MGVDRQVSFAAGELAQGLWGRTDLALYKGGAKRISNFIVTPDGVLTSRTGTQFIASLSKHGPGTARIIPFMVSESETYLVAFRALGGLASDVTIFKVSSTDPRHTVDTYQEGIYTTSGSQMTAAVYGQAVRRYLAFAQETLRLAVCCEGQPATEVWLDTDDGVFRHDLVSFQVPAYPLHWAGTDLPYKYPRVRFLDSVEEVAAAADASARNWTWALTHILRERETGKVYETRPIEIFASHVKNAGEDYAPYNYTIDGGITSDSGYVTPFTVNQKHTVTSAKPRTIYCSLEEGELVPGLILNAVVLASRLYRGREGRYGRIGETTGLYIDDYGEEPDYANPPPAGVDPFKVWEDDVLVRTEYPTAAGYYGRRRYLAGTSERTNKVWGSAVEKYSDFDPVPLADAADALSFAVDGRLAQEQIRALIPETKGLLVLTSVAEYMVTGVDGNAPSPADLIEVNPVGKHGSARVRVLEGDDAVFFVQTAGSIPWVGFRNDEGQFKWFNLGQRANHLFKGYQVVDWAYAENPHSVIWVARSDGALLSCTVVREAGVVAWAKHELSGDGLVESVAAILEGTEDAVYLVVNYAGTRHLERLAYATPPLNALGGRDIRYAVHLDRCVTYYGLKDSVPLEFAASKTVGEEIEFSTGDDSFAVGEVIAFDDPEGGDSYRVRISSNDGGGDYVGVVDNRDIDITETNNLASWWLCRSTVTGLDHLVGETVAAVADGNVHEGLVVTGTGIDLGWGMEAGIIHVGLPYNAEFQSLGTRQDREKQKIVNRIFVELEYTRGGEVGTDFDNLIDVRPREVAHGYLTLPGIRRDVDIPVPSRWDKDGQVVVRQSAPMPMTIVGVTRKYELGE